MLPPELKDIESVKERFSKAFDMESNWYSLNDDVYDYFLPQRNLFNTERQGQQKMDKIFDSTSLESIQEGASRIQENIAPTYKRWAKVEPSDKMVRDFEAGEYENAGVTLKEIRENLDKQSEIAFDYINNSNFSTQFYEQCLDLLIGTGTIKVDEEDSFEMPFSFHAIPPKGIAYEEGPNGYIETHWRKFKVKARNIERMWQGAKLSSEMKDRVSENADSMVDVCEGVVYSKDKYYGLMWIKGEDRYSWEQDFEASSPFITGRWAKASGEVRGRGPAMQCYPDVRSLNKAKEFVLQKAAIDLAGMYTATDDGVTNPYNITISPGVVIPVGSNNTSNPSIARLDTNTNLQLAEFEINELRTAIKRAFFNDLRDPAGPVRSATEVAIESRELAKRIGSAFGRLQTEVLTKILKRVFYILQKKGLVNINLEGIETTVKFTSPLAAAQDQEDLLAIQQAVEFTAITAGPEMVQASFALEKFGEHAAKLTGMSAELVRSEAERNQALQAGAEMTMQQAQQGNTDALE